MTHRNYVVCILFILLVTENVLIYAQSPKTTSENPSMTKTTMRLGSHSKFTAQPSERDRIRTFYQDVLGCKLTTRSENVDSFQLGEDFNIGVVYDLSSPPPAVISKGIWLELETDQPEELKARILHFGIQGMDYFDKKHFYFEAPGGQVFRIVKMGEVL